jgi:hypothetical protein
MLGGADNPNGELGMQTISCFSALTTVVNAERCCTA